MTKFLSTESKEFMGAAMRWSILAALVYGWVNNIVEIFSYGLDNPATLEIVLRVLGIPVWPIGIVMGYL